MASRSRKVAVIGSGFGGLGTAVRLASRGYDVELLEARDIRLERLRAAAQREQRGRSQCAQHPLVDGHMHGPALAGQGRPGARDHAAACIGAQLNAD